MRSYRLHFKRLSIWILLSLQLFLIGSYFLLQAETVTDQNVTPEHSSNVLFFKSNDSLVNNLITYHTINSKIELLDINTSNAYFDLNTSLCYKNGTDIKSMSRTKSLVWNCECLPGWHGNDCGQPEVVWRALLASRKQISLKGPRKYYRRVIYVFEVDTFSTAMAEIRVNELINAVDLFVMYESQSDNNLQHKLNGSFLKKYHKKILYLKMLDSKNIMNTIRHVVINLRSDDVVLTSKFDEIPNVLAINFFKLYDKWPEPLKFRFRWSVYGYFWLHPNKTIIRGGASTLTYLYDTLSDQIELLIGNSQVNPASKGFIVGDLNHFGGWYCEYCLDSTQIIDFLKTKPTGNLINSTTLDKRKIDNAYVEDLIENGIYLDGKTELIRTHRYQERYFAPYYVSENSWNYDWLLINLYSKIDYY